MNTIGIQEIEKALANLRLGSPQVHSNLALFPLVGEAAAADYVLLDEAIERGLARVTEVSAEGRVPELAFENASARKILLVDGDELVGAKQNRVLNLSILVGPGRKVVIPVSCVEQGRWRSRGEHFGSARRSLFSSARAKSSRSVTQSLSSSGTRRSNQSQVWADIGEKMLLCGASSETGAVGDLYASRDQDLSAYVHAFRAEPRQRGAVVAIDGKVVGLELFDSPQAFEHYLGKLVRSYALDALPTSSGKALSPTEDAVRRFLDSLLSAGAERFAALGEGEDIRLSGNGVTGGALASNGRVVHLAGFAV